ncbi:uncharacterized protein HD556DRAFT_1441783 [Suillus plorans]|uniref:Uncharacterized protein n=1 Tax=Suillus plorans TaxID=116603 RepID=A0A9P7DJP3_9AGAM|nr:uncharacterized protein HD556DRAFT_1441783 [Suillus plorans]KAG1795953.1 hypothetical protein HD556DRAFT_1441783 [Suillus plorans]
MARPLFLLAFQEEDFRDIDWFWLCYLRQSQGHLTSLNSVVLKTEAEIGDIKRARILFDFLVKSNPKHAPGELIQAGCKQCPGCMAGGSKIICTIPNSVRLRNETVNLEESATAARILLSRTTEVMLLSAELWFSLTRLEIPERAKAVLHKALMALRDAISNLDEISPQGDGVTLAWARPKERPIDHPWLAYARWGTEYGEIVYSRLFSQDIVIINSERVAHDLLDRRSYNYSTRPPGLVHLLVL